jgi:hypothetical protein
MQKKRRKLPAIKMAVTILSFTLFSIALFSIIVYMFIHIQIQSCINSPNCHQDQKQIPWVAPNWNRNYQVLDFWSLD